MAHLDFKKTLRNSEDFWSRAGNDPYFDWTIILTLSFIVALIFIGLSLRLFFGMNAEAADAGSTAAVNVPAAVPLDTSDLVNLIGIFETKKAEAPVFVATYPGPSDPAIPVRPAKTVASSTRSVVPAASAKK